MNILIFFVCFVNFVVKIFMDAFTQLLFGYLRGA